MKYIHCHCNDGCMAPVIAKEQSSKRWQLFGLSEVMGMGVGDWSMPLLPEPCDEVVALNRMDGHTSYVAFRQDALWSLLKIDDNGKLECEISLIEPLNSQSSLDNLLRIQGILKEDFIIGEIHEGFSDHGLYG